MVRWGQLAPSRHAEQVAAQVFRPDVYRQSLPAAASAAAPTQSFDRVAFSASDVPAYLGQFDIHTPFAHNRSG
jgi:hypothetical protein